MLQRRRQARLGLGVQRHDRAQPVLPDREPLGDRSRQRVAIDATAGHKRDVAGGPADQHSLTGRHVQHVGV